MISIPRPLIVALMAAIVLIAITAVLYAGSGR